MPQDDLERQRSRQQQTAGDVTIAGEGNAFNWVNAAIDQSRHIIYNYYYLSRGSPI